jgi:hypothetical protein
MSNLVPRDENGVKSEGNVCTLNGFRAAAAVISEVLKLVSAKEVVL